jgi:hypothetical protein
MTDYCESSDLFKFGLPRGAISNPARRVGAIDVSVNAFELEGHGLSANSPVSFRAEAGGSLTSPLVSGQRYYAQPVDDDHFSVSGTSGGAVVDLLVAGSRVLMITPLPIADSIAHASALIDNCLPAHVVPLTAPFPPLVRMVCAELAAGELGYFSGGVSKSMADMVASAQKILDRWAKGVPIRGTNAPKAARLSAVAGSTGGDARGWSRYGGTL